MAIDALRTLWAKRTLNYHDRWAVLRHSNFPCSNHISSKSSVNGTYCSIGTRKFNAEKSPWFFNVTPAKESPPKRNARENLDNLKLLSGEKIFHYLDFLLVNPDTTNLRNNALHGLMEQATREESALALHAAFALRARAFDRSILESWCFSH